MSTTTGLTTRLTTPCPAWCRGSHSGSVHSAAPRITDDGWGENVSVSVSLAPEDPHGYVGPTVSIDWRSEGICLTPSAAQDLALDLIAAAKEARA